MSNFAALNPEGYQRITGRFSRQLARSLIEFTGSSAGEKSSMLAAALHLSTA
jgi:hypothetical protein